MKFGLSKQSLCLECINYLDELRNQMRSLEVVFCMTVYKEAFTRIEVNTKMAISN